MLLNLQKFCWWEERITYRQFHIRCSIWQWILVKVLKQRKLQTCLIGGRVQNQWYIINEGYLLTNGSNDRYTNQIWRRKSWRQMIFPPLFCSLYVSAQEGQHFHCKSNSAIKKKREEDFEVPSINAILQPDKRQRKTKMLAECTRGEQQERDILSGFWLVLHST